MCGLLQLIPALWAEMDTGRSLVSGEEQLLDKGKHNVTAKQFHFTVLWCCRV